MSRNTTGSFPRDRHVDPLPDDGHVFGQQAYRSRACSMSMLRSASLSGDARNDIKSPTFTEYDGTDISSAALFRRILDDLESDAIPASFLLVDREIPVGCHHETADELSIDRTWLERFAAHPPSRACDMLQA